MLRSKSKKNKTVARGPEWVGGSVRLIEALERGALRVAGTLGVAKAAYVTNLPTDPDCALHTNGLVFSLVALEDGLGLNEN